MKVFQRPKGLFFAAICDVHRRSLEPPGHWNGNKPLSPAVYMPRTACIPSPPSTFIPSPQTHFLRLPCCERGGGGVETRVGQAAIMMGSAFRVDRFYVAAIAPLPQLSEWGGCWCGPTAWRHETWVTMLSRLKGVASFHPTARAFDPHW